VQALFSSVQYSFSDDGQTMVETLVLHVRDPKDLMSLSLEDSASSVSSVEAMLSSNTPVNRVRLERFGKSSLALARCSGTEAAAPRPIKAPMSRCSAAPRKCWPITEPCWACEKPCPRNWPKSRQPRKSDQSAPASKSQTAGGREKMSRSEPVGAESDCGAASVVCVKGSCHPNRSMFSQSNSLTTRGKRAASKSEFRNLTV
jgi:hypothetical protein